MAELESEPKTAGSTLLIFMKLKRRVKERGRRMIRKAERRTEGRGKGGRRKRGNGGKNNKDGRREQKEERSGESGEGRGKHSAGKGAPPWEPGRRRLPSACATPAHPPTPAHPSRLLQSTGLSFLCNAVTYH